MRQQKSFLAQLTKAQREELFHNMNYMNMEELKALCASFAIPYNIYVAKPNGMFKKTTDLDRKGIILDRIKEYLLKGIIKPATIIPLVVISSGVSSGTLKSNQRVLYGQYKNGDKNILHLLKKLSHNEFEFGAIAQEVIRACWAKGYAPSYKEFAQLWLKAKRAHDSPNPEWAYLADRKKGIETTNWKNIRSVKAQKAMQVLKSLSL